MSRRMRIAIGLPLLCFSGAGSLCNFIYLKEAGIIGLWIATVISMTAMWTVIIYFRLKEIWNLNACLCILGVFGVIQFVIIGKVAAPVYWNGNNEAITRLYGGFVSQVPVFLIGYGIARVIERSIDKKTFAVVKKIQSILEGQINELEDLDKSLNLINVQYKRTDRLLALFSLVSDSTLNNLYMDERKKRDDVLIKKAEKVLSSNHINMSFQEKTTSDIKQEVERLLKEKKEFLVETKSRNTRKDYGALKAKLDSLGMQ